VPTYWAFFVPAIVLLAFFLIDLFVIRDHPSEAGFQDFDTADASSGDEGPRLAPGTVFLTMMRNPVIVTILGIEFCSGFLRNAIMQWGPKFGKQTGLQTFVFSNWGMVLCVAGILGGMFAGVISDRLFDSRRGPVSSVLYGGMALGAIASFFLLGQGVMGWVVAFMSLCVIGVHGMLSGTASMDFGGKKNAGVAVGIIDGAVYAGTAAQSVLLGALLPSGEAAKVAENWINWPVAMIPLSLLGLVLATRVWNAKPQPKMAPPLEKLTAAPSTSSG
jgi:OPA family glycerol-3-phosphate transporter-like MFS transporter